MRCLAYRASRNCNRAWSPCKARAEKNALFCRSHLNAICGAYLGLCVRGFPERVGGSKAAANPTPGKAKQP
jgi:hypothetical protein